MKLASCTLAFAVLFGALEALVFESYLKGIDSYSAPIAGEIIYPYHAFLMFPLVVTFAFAISMPNKENVTFRQIILRMSMVIVTFAVIEDIMYFVFLQTPTQMNEWSCEIAGCIDLGFSALPIWYFIAGGTVAGLFLLNRRMNHSVKLMYSYSGDRTVNGNIIGLASGSWRHAWSNIRGRLHAKSSSKKAEEEKVSG